MCPYSAHSVCQAVPLSSIAMRIYYPGQKKKMRQPRAPWGTSACSLEHARACCLACVAVSIFLAQGSRYLFMYRCIIAQLHLEVEMTYFPTLFMYGITVAISRMDLLCVHRRYWFCSSSLPDLMLLSHIVKTLFAISLQFQHAARPVSFFKYCKPKQIDIFLAHIHALPLVPGQLRWFVWVMVGTKWHCTVHQPPQ